MPVLQALVHAIAALQPMNLVQIGAPAPTQVLCPAPSCTSIQLDATALFSGCAAIVTQVGSSTMHHASRTRMHCTTQLAAIMRRPARSDLEFAVAASVGMPGRVPNGVRCKVLPGARRACVPLAAMCRLLSAALSGSASFRSFSALDRSPSPIPRGQRTLSASASGQTLQSAPAPQAVRRVLPVACCMPRVACCMLEAACCLLHAACCMLHVVCSMLRVPLKPTVGHATEFDGTPGTNAPMPV
jgi:hypothetical protein